MAERLTPEQVQQIVETAINPFCVIDAAGTALWASDSVEELLGRSAEELVGRSVVELVAPESVDHVLQSLAAATEYLHSRPDVAGWEGAGPIVEVLRPDGTTVSCSIAVATPVRTGLPGFVLQLRRADSSHALEDALIAMGRGDPLGEVLSGLAGMLEGEVPDAEVAIARHTPDGELEVLVGPEWCTGGLSVELLSGTPWEKALAEPGALVERSVDDLPAGLRTAPRDAGHRWLTVLGIAPSSPRAPSGVLALWSRHTYPMHVFSHERVHRCAALVALVLQWERGRRALQWAADHDVLTGLHNRAAFINELDAIEALRQAQPLPAAVLYLDLDDFKPVNDDHGHALGDRVLVEVAERLRRCVRPSDVVARLGGDEFAVLCPGLDDLALAEQLAQRLVVEVSDPIEVDGLEVKVGLSVGIAALLDGEDADAVLSRADSALRCAKVQGKSRWQLG